MLKGTQPDVSCKECGISYTIQTSDYFTYEERFNDPEFQWRDTPHLDYGEAGTTSSYPRNYGRSLFASLREQVNNGYKTGIGRPVQEGIISETTPDSETAESECQKLTEEQRAELVVVMAEAIYIDDMDPHMSWESYIGIAKAALNAIADKIAWRS